MVEKCVFVRESLMYVCKCVRKLHVPRYGAHIGKCVECVSAFEF